MKTLTNSIAAILLLLLANLAGSSNLQAQFWIDSYALNPNPPVECEDTDITITGFMPCINYTASCTPGVATGTTITVDVLITGPAICLPAIGNYTCASTLPIVPAGSYTLVINQYHLGVLAETLTQSITVDPCFGCGPAPDNLMANVSTTAVNLSWDAPAAAVGCRVCGGLSGTMGIACRNASSSDIENVSIPLGSIPPGDYFYYVQCACSLSPLELTDASSFDFFTVPTPRLSAAAHAQVSLSPNPASSYVTLVNQNPTLTNAATDKTTVRLLDQTGRLVQEVIFDQATIQLDVSELAKGVYFVEIIGVGSRDTQKLIVQ